MAFSFSMIFFLYISDPNHQYGTVFRSGANVNDDLEPQIVNLVKNKKNLQIFL
jgi:hypothetical protein